MQTYIAGPYKRTKIAAYFDKREININRIKEGIILKPDESCSHQ